MTDRGLHLTVDYCTYCMYMTYQPIVLSKMRIRPSKKSLLDHCSSGSRVFAILSRENGQSCSLFIFPNSEIRRPKSPDDKFSAKLVDSRSIAKFRLVNFLFITGYLGAIEDRAL